jgi:hypothetical protein
MNNGKVSHASFAVGVRANRSSPSMFDALSFWYEIRKPGSSFVYSAQKFLAEGGEHGETPWQTVCSGIFSELSARPEDPTSIEFRAADPRNGQAEPEPFLVHRSAGDPSKGAEWHDKYVYIVLIRPESDVNFRQDIKPEGPNERIGPPEYMEAGELWKLMAERGQAFHRAVLFRTIKRFAATSSAARERYSFILDNPLSQNLMRNRDGLIRFNND